MVNKNAIGLLIKRGFRYIGCNQPDVAIFYRPEDATQLDVCILTDCTGGYIYSPTQLSSIAGEVERKFIFNGYRSFKCHFIIFTDNINRDRQFTDSELSFWLVDTLVKKVIIYDNQPIDFHLMRKELEQLISEPVHTLQKKTGFPYITATLISANILIFIIMEIFGDTQNTIYMSKYGAMSWRFLFENKEYYRLFTSIFLHFGGEHLINNMITLAVVGNEVERVIGHFRFIAIYLLSGIGANLVSALYNMNVNHDRFIISAGASGAIFGIIGALLVVSLLYRSVRRIIKPANIAIIAMLSIANGFMNFEIDNMAHIGGLMFGIIITFISCLYAKSVIK